ncbi:hypothetical protein CYMTET_27023 [Cymbomonas tetramitiformis]|uniref:Uncharacterized protein n=1 Tax=Cymbomonas tetramitiformis TaxID=36881 RepID=A0AAE0FR73_9CHLO|nr:hypothetical protein CYMTET_27023 [Cymbomonas tetramitiformis]
MADLSIDAFANTTYTEIFKLDYIAEVARDSGADPADVVVTDIKAGSVLVDTTITYRDEASAADFYVLRVEATQTSFSQEFIIKYGNGTSEVATDVIYRVSPPPPLGSNENNDDDGMEFEKTTMVIVLVGTAMCVCVIGSAVLFVVKRSKKKEQKANEVTSVKVVEAVGK